jgi:hypothetical protein
MIHQPPQRHLDTFNSDLSIYHALNPAPSNSLTMHDHNLRKRKPAEAEAPKKVVKRVRRQVSSSRGSWQPDHYLAILRCSSAADIESS